MPHLRLRPEEEAVLLCSRFERTIEQEAALRRLFGDGRFAWPDLWAEANEQEVLPLVARALTDSALADVVPEAVEANARALRRQLTVHCLTLHGELRRIGRRLQDEGIPVVPLKGTDLSARLYGTIDSRRPGDIDILVPMKRLDDARAVLRACGYAQATSVTHGLEAHSFHGIPWVREDSRVLFVVELHWGLNDQRFVTIDYDALWSRIITQGTDGRGFHRLPDEELLVFLAMHLSKHDIGLLRLLGDIDRLIRRTDPTLDWLYVLNLAERWSAAGLLYFALVRAGQILGTPIPSWALLRLCPGAWCRHLVTALVGPTRVLRPPPVQHVRNNTFRFAYCAMLRPKRRSLGAIWHYFFDPPRRQPHGPLDAAVSTVQRVAHGLAWTMFVLASAFVPWLTEYSPRARRLPIFASARHQLPSL